jgi:hypothetical protein
MQIITRELVSFLLNAPLATMLITLLKAVSLSVLILPLPHM